MKSSYKANTVRKRKRKRRSSSKVLISKRVKEYFFILLALDAASEEIQMSAMKNASKEFLLAITEIAKNIASGNVELTEEQYVKLNRYAKTINEIINKKTSEKRKRRLLQQGGFLGALAGPLIGALSPLLSNLVSGLFPNRQRDRRQ